MSASTERVVPFFKGYKPEWYLRKIQGVCISCDGIIDKTRVESDKPSARIYCDKCKS